MAKFAGVDVLVKVMAGTPGVATVVGGQQGASLSRQLDTIETTAKDSAGKWKELVAGFKSWSVDCDGFIIESDAGFSAMDTAFQAGTTVDVEIALPSGKKFSGEALVTDFSYDFPFDDAAKYKLTLTGAGALTVI